jgi:hypothetical protein
MSGQRISQRSVLGDCGRGKAGRVAAGAGGRVNVTGELMKIYVIPLLFSPMVTTSGGFSSWENSFLNSRGIASEKRPLQKTKIAFAIKFVPYPFLERKSITFGSRRSVSPLTNS